MTYAPPGLSGATTSSTVGPERIAYQGEPGANSHLVCLQHYPELIAAPYASFEDVFTAVECAEADLAMIPIDNSVAGRVADIHQFLPVSELHIVAEHFLRIRFHLLGMPGARLESITTVHSHLHALGQCRKIIREHGWASVISGDTAGAAREVADAGDPTQAAISPPMAAQIYGLDVLATDVEDEAHNTTRFVVLSREPIERAPGYGPVVTSFVFKVRNQPAALYKALGGFATNGVNMTKLESYMVDGEFTATQFLADVDGHPAEAGLARALAELAFFTHEIKILGVYPADPFRFRISPVRVDA